MDTNKKSASEESALTRLKYSNNLSQCQKVLEYIRIYGSITNWEAYQDLRILRLSARIWDLRHSGYRIKSIDMTDDERGTHFSKYMMDDKEAI